MVDEAKPAPLARTRKEATLEELLEGANKMVDAGAVRVVDKTAAAKAPAEPLVAVQIRIPASIAEMIDRAAFEQKTSKSAYILLALSEHYGLPIPAEWTAQTKRRRS